MGNYLTRLGSIDRELRLTYNLNPESYYEAEKTLTLPNLSLPDDYLRELEETLDPEMLKTVLSYMQDESLLITKTRDIRFHTSTMKVPLRIVNESAYNDVLVGIRID